MPESNIPINQLFPSTTRTEEHLHHYVSSVAEEEQEGKGGGEQPHHLFNGDTIHTNR